jgi:hypothetical protein
MQVQEGKMNNMMKMIVLGGGLVLGAVCSHAQTGEAMDVPLADAPPPPPPLALPLVEESEVPESGSFYSAQLYESQPPYPFNPLADLGLPIYSLGTDLFLIDDRAVNLEQRQTEAALLRAAALSLGLAVEEDEAGGGMMMSALYESNDLWLEITGVTNFEAGPVACLVIHPPETETNGIHDLYYTTNLNADAPGLNCTNWQWVLRTAPGQTNLTVPEATNPVCFYRLGPPDDLKANSSLGTNFWIAFFNMYDADGLSLYITSPVGATGTVFAPGLLTNGPVLTVAGAGDTNVNGTYVLTNLSAQPGYPFASTLVYVNGPFQVGVAMGGYLLASYDSGLNEYTYLYLKIGDNLNATDWEPWHGIWPAPTTSCIRYPFSQPFSVSPGTVSNVSILPAAMIADYDVVGTNGIQITASQPVAIYGVAYSEMATAAFTVYPTPLLGTNYCVMARPSLCGYSSEFAVVATADNTTVQITPSATANLWNHLGTNSYATNLNVGQTYQIKSSDDTNDVTGTWIASDKPVAVFAGANVGFVPDANTRAGNPLVQEQLPVDSWGKQALALGFAGRTNGASYRVLAACNDTEITISGVVVTIVDEPGGGPWTVTASNEVVVVTNHAGQFYDIIVDGPVEFQGSQPIQVAQFANGTISDHGAEPYGGDPCEILLPPTGHYLETNIVVTLPNDYVSGDFDENYLNLIVPQSATNSTWVDGSLVAATNYMAIGTSGYYGAQIAVTNSGAHTVTSSQPVGVEVYGFGYYDAYGYFGGVVK